MDIKIRARLSAYSKVSSIDSISTELPLAGKSDAGSVVGVGEDGSYTLFPTSNKDSIDEMFTYSSVPTPVEKQEIDGLFSNEDTATSVTKDAIDSLFTDSKTSGVVGKEEIDSLFTNSTNNASVVRFNDVGSLSE